MAMVHRYIDNHQPSVVIIQDDNPQVINQLTVSHSYIIDGALIFAISTPDSFSTVRAVRADIITLRNTLNEWLEAK